MNPATSVEDDDDSLQGFAKARKDVIYDFLKREDINWRDFHLQTARKVYQDHPLKDCRLNIHSQ